MKTPYSRAYTFKVIESKAYPYNYAACLLVHLPVLFTRSCIFFMFWIHQVDFLFTKIIVNTNRWVYCNTLEATVRYSNPHHRNDRTWPQLCLPVLKAVYIYTMVAKRDYCNIDLTIKVNLICRDSYLMHQNPSQHFHNTQTSSLSCYSL